MRRDVGVGLLERDALLQTRKAAPVSLRKPASDADQLHGIEDVGRVIEEPERIGEHANELARDAVHDERPPDRVGAAETALPVRRGK